MNIAILVGRLTRDPELRYTQSNKAVIKFSLAVDRPFNRDETDFIDIVAWEKLAENCAKYIAKGSQVAVEGRIQVRSYEHEGQKRKAVEVVANTVKFLDKKGDR